MNDNCDVGSFQSLLNQLKLRPLILRNYQNQVENSGFTDEEIFQLYFTAVTEDGRALEFVPEDKRTNDLCIAAVNQEGGSLQFVPANVCDKAMCHAAINQNGLALQYVPPDLYDQDLCRAAISQNGSALRYVPKYLCDRAMCLAALSENGQALEYVPASLCDRDMCRAALSQTEWALRYVPKNLFDRDMCLDAVRLRGAALQLVPKNLCDRELYFSATSQNGMALRYVPENLRDRDMCRAAINQTGLALQYVPPDLCDQDLCRSAVSQNGLALSRVPIDLRDDLVMCLDAVNQNGLALQYVPETFPNLRDQNICFAAVSKNGSALSYVPQYLRDQAMCLAAVSKNGMALEFVLKSKLSHEAYLSICIAAVKQDGLALQYVDEDMKHVVIDAVTPQKILSHYYEALQYFPSKPDYNSEINQFLSQVNHVVITENNDLINDNELKDIYLVYANSPTREGKIIHTDKSYAKRLLEDLKVYSQKQDINLILLGHSNAGSTKIADLNISETTDLLRYNENINKLTLLGCNTAKSLKLEQEKEMIRHFSEAKKTRANNYCGMILLSRQPDPSEYVNLLKKIEQDRDRKIIERAYILSKTTVDGKEQYQLIHIQRNTANMNDNNNNNDNDNAMNKVIATILSFDPEKLKNLEMLKGKKSPFPKDPAIPTYLRGGKGAQCMNEKELEEISAVIDNADKFDKKHPNYKQTKQEYPALGSIIINETEKNKLQQSLLKRMVEAIHNDPFLKRKIIVKGYTKALHVDTKERRMLVSRTHLYPSIYNTSNFYTQKDNIKRKNFVNEIESDMKKGADDGPTIAKSIKIIINKKN